MIRNELLIQATTWMNHVKNVHLKSHILYDSIYITFSRWQSYKDGKHLSGGGRAWVWLQKVAGGNGTVLCISCGSMNLHVWYNSTEPYTHVPASVFWFWYYTTVTWDIAIGGTSVKVRCGFSALPLQLPMYLHLLQNKMFFFFLKIYLFFID